MAKLKTRPTALSVAAFLDSCADERQRTGAKSLTRLMQKVTDKQPKMWGSAIVGFDSYHYTYESGHEGDMPVLGFSPRKSAIVLYGTLGIDGADLLLAKLGKHTTGKGCLYIKKLEDVNMEVLEDLLRNAVAARRAQASG